MRQKKQRQWMSMAVQGNKTQLRTPMLIWPEKIWPRLALASCLDLLVGGREASMPNWSPLYDWYTGCPVVMQAAGDPMRHTFSDPTDLEQKPIVPGPENFPRQDDSRPSMAQRETTGRGVYCTGWLWPELWAANALYLSLSPVMEGYEGQMRGAICSDGQSPGRAGLP